VFVTETTNPSKRDVTGFEEKWKIILNKTCVLYVQINKRKKKHTGEALGEGEKKQLSEIWQLRQNWSYETTKFLKYLTAFNGKVIING
jgi:hypothetical protein